MNTVVVLDGSLAMQSKISGLPWSPSKNELLKRESMEAHPLSRSLARSSGIPNLDGWPDPGRFARLPPPETGRETRFPHQTPDFSMRRVLLGVVLLEYRRGLSDYRVLL